MKQDKIEVGKVEKDPLKKLKEEFDQVKKTAKFKKVRVLFHSCCGCGCADVTLERTVPEDSDLEDGDSVDEWLDSDVVIDNDDE